MLLYQTSNYKIEFRIAKNKAKILISYFSAYS